MTAIKSAVATATAPSAAPPGVPLDPNSPSKEALIQPAIPFLTRIWLYYRVYSLKLFVKFFTFVLRRARPLPVGTQPTLLKAYPVRPNLQNRVFIPKSYDGKTKLPLYLDIHGGGFCLMDPETDDHLNARLANDNNMIVVSLNYYKGPRSRFPGPVDDTYEIAKAVINDETLPIDKSRIAIGGYSAGGNLSLSIVQKEGLKGLIKGVVAFYPAVDMSTSIDYKLETRPITEKVDMLKDNGVLFDFAYVPAGTDRTNPLLSPTYAPRSSFPDHLYLIGAEEDLLCDEARVFAEKMAGFKPGVAGRDVIKGVDAKDGWEEGTIRYEIMRKCEHSFTHMPQQKPEVEEWRRKQLDAILTRVGAWLQNGPLKK